MIEDDDRDEQAFFEALAEHVRADAPAQPNDAAIVEAALRAVPATEAPRRSGRAVWISAAVAIAAAALLWVAMPESVQLEGAQGSWATEAGDTIAQGEVMPAQTWLRVADEACMARGEALLCATAGSRLRVTDAQAQALELDEGSVRVDAGTWAVTLAGQVHQLGPGDTVSAARILAHAHAHAPEPEPVAVPDPVVVPEPEPEPIVEDAPADSPKPAVRRPASKPQPDAATLVARARKALGEHREAEAEKTYEELLRRFPRSPEAKVGRVSLAGLKLQRGKAKAALRLYSAAAKGGGPTAEEAAWGRIRALHRLGRDSDLRKAVDAFAAKYPRSAYRARAQGLVEP